MITGSLVIITPNGTPLNTEGATNLYSKVVSALGKVVADKFNANDFDIYQYDYDIDSAQRQGLPTDSVPVVFLLEDKLGTFFLKGDNNVSDYYSFFYNIFKGNVSQTGSNGTGSSDWGFSTGLDDRKCSTVDSFLDFLHFGKIKQYVYLGGAVYFAFNAVMARNQLLMAASGGLSAGCSYLGLKKPDSACESDIAKDGKSILIGGVLAVGSLAAYHLFFKEELKTRRLVRILRASNSTPSVKTASKTTASRRPVKRVKSVTTTKRY